MEGMTVKRLPHLGIHPINSHQTQTLLHMPAKFCWQEPDISVSCEAMPVPGKYRSGCSQLSNWMEHRAPNGGDRERTQGAKGVCIPTGRTTMWTNQYPRALDSSCICNRRWPSWLSLGRKAPWSSKLYMPQYRENNGAKKCEWVGREAGEGQSIGDCGDSIWNVN